MERLGPETLTDAELLAIIISSGIPEKSAEEIAKDIVKKFGSFKGIAGQDYEKFLEIEGLGNEKGEHLPLDFKTSNTDPREKEILEAYQSQMDVIFF